ncbi:hypothetical protein CKN56_11545 [Carnobacterium divergens]|uniref:Uncharacterized protein n=1 Tax=Carnobacterium divergens TaxID=2748 RepID=A0A7Z8G4V2_CARDV|nr:hypothetical protein CKN56_11545 [Carnobacterium divergens]TFJ22717.1 hypothetical protein CKN87_11475 [Carnobacterium divergens]TFJ25224.1 hypothetical protein CKN69_11475 [Carnobacterium divergens]
MDELLSASHSFYYTLLLIVYLTRCELFLIKVTPYYLKNPAKLHLILINSLDNLKKNKFERKSSFSQKIKNKTFSQKTASNLVSLLLKNS